MKTLYLNCSMGAAGDMLAASLLGLVPDPSASLARLNALGIPGVRYGIENVSRGGIAGIRLVVQVNGEEEGHHHHHHGHHHHEHHHHEHRSLDDILHIIGHLDMSDSAKNHAAEVYRLIASAESRAHGRPVGEVHFHEVGAMDAVADVSAVCLLLEELGAGVIIASPVNMGGGTVKCAHGIMPVPAPATASLLEGIPAYSDDPSLGELCTPTGAALLKHFAGSFGPMPVLRISATAYGAGGKDFQGRANLLRASIGESASSDSDEVLELACNVDDMTGEEIAFACNRIFAAGALDVATLSACMKKGRPGVIFDVLCRPSGRDAVVSAIFKHTSTLGVRETLCRRYVLSRKEISASIAGGVPARLKVSEGWGVRREKLEFDDVAENAIARDMSLRDAAKRDGV